MRGSAYQTNDLLMRDQTYDTYGNSDHEEYDEYINRNGANNRRISNDLMAVFKNNKLIIILVLFLTFSFGALLIGLPVGLLAPSRETLGKVISQHVME